LKAAEKLQRHLQIAKNKQNFFIYFRIMKSPSEGGSSKTFCKITLKTKMHYCHLKCKHALSCHRSFESWLFALLAWLLELQLQLQFLLLLQQRLLSAPNPHSPFPIQASPDNSTVRVLHKPVSWDQFASSQKPF